MNKELPAARGREEHSRPARWRILIVDDGPWLSQNVWKLVTLHGYHARVCRSLPKAIEILAEESFDLVLLNFVAPKTEVGAAIQDLSHHYPGIPVILVSGIGTIDAAMQDLSEGKDALRKPYQPEALLHMMEHALCQSCLVWPKMPSSEYSDSFYKFIVDSSPDIIYTLNEEGCFTYINYRVETLLGFSREELLGKQYSTILHDEDMELARHALNERRTGARASHNVELRFKCKHDGYRSLDTRFVTVVLNAMGIYGMGWQNGRPFIGSYGIARDISDRKKAEEIINYQAFYDTLTDLPNRNLFKDRLGVAISQAQRDKHKLAVLFFDLDRFKWVNDTMGHLHGDELLRSVASRLKNCLRTADTLARLGGDEFTMVLPEIAHEDDAAVIARKVLGELERPFVLGGNEVVISASIGISIFPDHGDSFDALIKHADAAMYYAKAEGKGGYRYYEPTMLVTSHRWAPQGAMLH